MITSENRKDRADVVLISPPVSFTIGPSLALGLLKAALLRGGVSCHVDYADLHFTEALGPELAKLIITGNMKDFYGEFIFNGPAGIEPKYGLDEIARQIYRSGDPMLAMQVRNGLIRAGEIAAEQTEETVRRILTYEPKVVGVTSSFQQRNAAIAIMRRIKELRPDIVTVMGGCNCFGEAGLAILRAFPCVDYVFFGESDDIFADVLKNAMTNPGAPLPYGVLRNGDPLPDEAPHRIVTDMDALPYPDFDEFFEILSTETGKAAYMFCTDDTRNIYEISLFLESSRGCWWGSKSPCTFCGLHHKIRTYRRKSARRMFDELVAVTEKYGIRSVLFTDCVMPVEWMDEFVPLLKAYPRRLRLFQELKSNYTGEQILALAEAGIVNVQPGIESFSDHSLKLMNKGVTAIQNLNFLKYGKKYGLRISWNILVGFPGETPEDYREQYRLFPLVQHFVPPNSCAWIVYARGNAYANDPEKYGLTLLPCVFYNYICPQDPAFIDGAAIYYDRTTLPDPEILKEYEILSRECAHWRSAYAAADRNVRLDMVDQGESLLIIDTRDCRDLRAQLLLGAERDVYRLCASPVREERVAEALDGQYAAETVSAAVESLISKKLLVKASGRLLALAVETDMETLKKRDIRDFQRLYQKSTKLQSIFSESCAAALTRGEEPDAAARNAIGSLARRLGMCFSGEEYEKYATLR